MRYGPSFARVGRGRLGRFALFVATLVLLAVPAPLVVAQPAAPTTERVANIPLPTDIAFADSGDLFVTSQSGILYRRRADQTAFAPALDLRGIVCANGERGLLGVAPAPDFASSSQVYVYYTARRSGGCPSSSAEIHPPPSVAKRALARCDRIKLNKRRAQCRRDVRREFPPTVPPAALPVNRVARFTVGNVASQSILVDNITSLIPNHNGGDLQFGNDGLLYISVGDGGCQIATREPLCGGDNQNSLSLDRLNGKILRVNRDGVAPASNPYAANGVACAKTGRAQPGQRCREIFASGLRNPFRFAFDPTTAPTTTRFFINDVGRQTWEEINEGRVGANYGWNVCEGAFVQDSATRLCSLPGTVDPVSAYRHTTGCRSITGGAFAPANALGGGGAYVGDYFYADFVCAKIFRLDLDADGNPTGPPAAFPLDVDPKLVVPLAFGPDGALYFGTYENGGQIRRTVP